MQAKLKLTIDVVMIVAMFFSMSLHLFGAGVHKGIGLVTFLLFIIHNLLNRKWYAALLRGNYGPGRAVHILTNILVCAAMLGILLSGGMLARELAAGAGDAMTTGRILHNVSSYTGCIGIAVHIGFHVKRRKDYDDR